MNNAPRPDLVGEPISLENMTRDEPRKATPKPRPTKPFPDADRLDETDKIEIVLTTGDGTPYASEAGKTLPPKTEHER